MTGTGLTPRGRAARFLTSAGRGARWLTMRLYALALIALLSYATYRAFRYLVITLLVSAPPPAAITQLPRRLDTHTLETDRHAWAGLETVEHARAPLAHYHRLDAWIQPDRASNCTTSGCHPALPHAERKEVRAFLNMHATTLHCGVCHMTDSATPLKLTWYDPRTGDVRTPPAVLQAHQLLLTLAPTAAEGRLREEDRTRLIALLRQAAADAQDGALLATLADHFAATPATSADNAALIETALEAVPRYSRGEYGAKIALADPATGQAVLAHPGVQMDVREFLLRRDSLEEPARQQLLEKIHSRRRPQTLLCSDCHTPPGLVDFAALGYPPQRVADLTGSIVVQMIQHIAEGRPFYLPTFARPKREEEPAPPSPGGQAPRAPDSPPPGQEPPRP